MKHENLLASLNLREIKIHGGVRYHRKLVKPFAQFLLCAFCVLGGEALAASQPPDPAEAPPRPRIECDAAMLHRAKERLAAKVEPFHSYWQLAKAEAA
ncbi:MAG: hypothetical protein KDM63_20285, partial [Verrucomicrobiae bacterium]|nr:hypothetical protein [Verrucomicrobiae bacterium]